MYFWGIAADSKFQEKMKGTYFRRGTYLRGFTVVSDYWVWYTKIIMMIIIIKNRTHPRSREGSIYATGVCDNRWSRKAHNCVPEATGSDHGWEERWSLLHYNGLAESAPGFQSAAVSHSLPRELTPKGLMRSGWPATCFGHWPCRKTALEAIKLKKQ